MTYARRNALRVGLLVAGLFFSSYPAARALDRPTIDTKSTVCSVNLTGELVQQLPTSGRTIEALSNVVPAQMSLSFQFNSRQKPTSATLTGENFQWTFPRVRLNERDCTVKGEISRAQFGSSGYTGKVELTYHTRPEGRAYLRAYDLRSPGGPVIRGDQLWFFKPTLSTGIELPRPEDLPVKPPGQPIPPAPTDPRFSTAFQGPNGLVLPPGTLVDMKLSVLNHGDFHDKHSVEYGGRTYRLCQFDTPRSQLRVYDTSPDRFSLEKISRPNLGWEWSPFQCDATGCRGEGKFFGQPIRAWTPEVPQVSVSDQSAQGKLDIELNNNVVPFSFTARYKFNPGGSTQVLPPSPVAPIVPVVPPQPIGYQIPGGGPLIQNGFKFDVTSTALPHSPEECERHTFTVGGTTYQLCRVGEGSSIWEAYGADLDGFNLHGLSTTRRDVNWQDGRCGKEGCRFKGTIYGQPAEKFVYPPRDAWTSSGVRTQEEVTLYPGQPNRSVTPFQLDIRGLF